MELANFLAPVLWEVPPAEKHVRIIGFRIAPALQLPPSLPPGVFAPSASGSCPGLFITWTGAGYTNPLCTAHSAARFGLNQLSHNAWVTDERLPLSLTAISSSLC